MNKEKLYVKIVLFLSFLTGAIWFGSSLVRSFIIYNLFERNEFILKQIYNLENLKYIFLSINPLISTSIICYVIFIITFFIYLFVTNLKVKNNGWLFIILVLILLALPFELYLMTIDYKIFMKIFYENFDSREILQLTIKRYKVLGSIPLINLFTYCTFLYLFIFQPLKKNNEN